MDKISPERLRFEEAREREGYQESGEFSEISNLTKFRQKDRFEEASERGGYQGSGEFDENGEFGEIGDWTKFRRKDLDLRKRAKERGIRKAANLTKTANLAELEIWRNFARKT